MHDTQDVRNSIDRELAESPELLGKECVCCIRALRYNHFRKDSSFRDGRSDRCTECESAPALSTREHVDALNEKNFIAAGRQRWAHQLDYMNDEARMGHWMDHVELVRRLDWICKDLLFIPGNFKGDLSLYKIYGRKQPELDNRDFSYLMYVPTDYTMPEASLIEFNNMLVPVREKKRGWRTVLLRLIKSRIITEDDCKWAFGEPTPGADIVWSRELWQWRNGKKI
jgi:hypothetical protein